MRKLSDSVTNIKGVGAKRAQQLQNLGLWQIEDLLYYFPFRYEDRSKIADLSQLNDGDNAFIFGSIAQIRNVRLPGGKLLVRVIVRTDSGNITLLWFNQPYVTQKMALGALILAYGKYHVKKEKQLAVQDYQVLAGEDELEQYLGIMPVYPASSELSENMLKKYINLAVDEYLPLVEEYLPLDIREEHHLADLSWAIAAIHQPKSWQELNIARYRLVFDEFLLLLLSLAEGKAKEKAPGVAHLSEASLTKRFFELLSFELTDAQKRVIMEIKRDMESPYAMQRLLQGDVGSGKTIVAIFALLKAVENGKQAVLMVPTEILAEQHYWSLQKYLEPLGVKAALLTSSVAKKDMYDLKTKIALGEIAIVVGTHAVLEDDVRFKNLSLVVIDEQHRFGVRQQLTLQNKSQAADVLVMTATPIPRSLALTIYGDLDLSVIDELPKGRQKIITWAIGEKKRAGMYKFLAEHIAGGEQVYIVCPLVNQSDKLDLANVVALEEKLATEIFPAYRVALLHGQMKSAEKTQIMDEFRLGKIDILVSTTVIEVGVDVANATIMVIENAERFGLAQLHQLRGRIGRGTKQSYCILLANPTTDEGKRRLEVMTKSNDGFFIAEADLNIRGPGEVLGLRQHGLPELKIANLAEDIVILEQAKEVAEQIKLTNNDTDNDEHSQALKARLARINTTAKCRMEGLNKNGQSI